MMIGRFVGTFDEIHRTEQAFGDFHSLQYCIMFDHFAEFRPGIFHLFDIVAFLLKCNECIRLFSILDRKIVKQGSTAFIIPGNGDVWRCCVSTFDGENC